MNVCNAVNGHLMHVHCLFPQNETHQTETHSSGAQIFTTGHDDINMETTIGRQVIAKAIKAAF